MQDYQIATIQFDP
jgi:hypothetical protein